VPGVRRQPKTGGTCPGMKEFGRMVSKARTKQKITQGDLAGMVNIDMLTMHRIEEGHANVTPEVKMALLEALGIVEQA
jgi:transcriptional regulator with XRE-family HTH domain